MENQKSKSCQILWAMVISRRQELEHWWRRVRSPVAF